MELPEALTLHAGDISGNTVHAFNNNFDLKIQSIDNNNSYNDVMDISSNEYPQRIKNPTDMEIKNHVNNALTNLPECAEPNSNLTQPESLNY